MDGRNEKGQFIKGVKHTPGFEKGKSGNPKGRLPRAKERSYLDIMLSVCTPEKWREVCLRAVEDAVIGDDKARKWLADYIVGTPVQRTEITGAEGGPLIVENYDYNAAIADIADGSEGDS